MVVAKIPLNTSCTGRVNVVTSIAAVSDVIAGSTLLPRCAPLQYQQSKAVLFSNVIGLYSDVRFVSTVKHHWWDVEDCRVYGSVQRLLSHQSIILRAVCVKWPRKGSTKCLDSSMLSLEVLRSTDKCYQSG